MALVKVLYDFDITPQDYGLYYGYARKLSDTGFTGKTALRGGTSYAIFIADTEMVKVICINMAANFIFTPRIYGQNDGYDENGPVGEGDLTYPLDDSSETSATLRIDDDEMEIGRDLQLYGNVDWKGTNTAADGEPSNAPVLTWRGPAGRSIPFDYDTYVEGFTTPDIKFSETGADKWTCFGRHIYQSGDILDTLPTVGDVEPKVLGCALTTYEKDGEDVEALVAIVNNHYSEEIGFYDEVWYKDSEWVKIHSQVTGRPSQCWFFNESGNKATQGVAEYSINLTDKAVSLDAGTNTSLSTEYRLNSDGHEVIYSGTTKVWSDYKGDERVFASVAASGGHRFISITGGSSNVQNVDVYVAGEKPAPTLFITGVGYGNDSTAANVNSQFVLNGAADTCCDSSDVTWTFSSGSISSDGKILSVTGCGSAGESRMATITATVCGDTATKSVRVTGGVWVLTLTEGSYGGTAPPQEYKSGGSKVVEYYGCGCGIKSVYNTIDLWAGCCNQDYPVVTSYLMYAASSWRLIGPPQVPTLDEICLSQQISCGTGATNTTYYTPCTGVCPGGVPGAVDSASYDVTQPSGYAKAEPLLRYTYAWRCP